MERAAAGLPPAGLRRRPRAAHVVRGRAAADAARATLRGRQPLPRRFRLGDGLARHAQGGVALRPPGHRPRGPHRRRRGAPCAGAERLPARPGPRQLARRVRARLDGAAPPAGARRRRCARPLRGDRRRARGCCGRGQPRTARLAGHGARRGRRAGLGRLGPAGRAAGAACVVRRRLAVAAHARRHPRHLDRTDAAARPRPRLGRSRLARTPARRRRARAARLERSGPERILARTARSARRSRPAARHAGALACARGLGAAAPPDRRVAEPTGRRIPRQQPCGAPRTHGQRLAAVRRCRRPARRGRPRRRGRGLRIAPLRA
ncbi:hypothetical protein D3C72_1376610 [compost metagenome]